MDEREQSLQQLASECHLFQMSACDGDAKIHELTEALREVVADNERMYRLLDKKHVDAETMTDSLVNVNAATATEFCGVGAGTMTEIPQHFDIGTSTDIVSTAEVECMIEDYSYEN